MKTWLVLSLSILVVGMTTVASAQGWMMGRGGGWMGHGGGWMMGAGRNAAPGVEATLTGTVDEVRAMPEFGRGNGGVHLLLNTQSGPVYVMVGPSSVLSSRNVSFAKGDTLTVVGTKATMMWQDVVMARQITKGDQTLTLRDETGFPAWAGGCGRW